VHRKIYSREAASSYIRDEGEAAQEIDGQRRPAHQCQQVVSTHPNGLDDLAGLQIREILHGLSDAGVDQVRDRS
jgi:hypothetical protein